MLRQLQKRWFLVALFVLIATGLTAGAQSDPQRVNAASGMFSPRLVTALVLFLMSFSLDSGKLRRSFRSPGPVAWASAVNFILIPLLAWCVMPLQQGDDFRIGLMIAACVPCTMAAASVWTRRAGGNDAVSLLVTILTNGICFIVTPFWLLLATRENAALDFEMMFWRLVLAVLIPTLLGQLVRRIPAPGRFAVRWKTALGVVAQTCILTIVFSAALNAGTRLGGTGPKPGAAAVAMVWGSCIAIHLVAMLVGVLGAKRLGFRREDCIAVAFSSSQKTLPIGVLIATDPRMFGNPDLLGTGLAIPFVVFPMLMYHASQ
ncbi:MAG: bile acid:sodium symporter, partial [Planctomycetes bacterium]|nr:bile acid:sodium symporter [Planctomycetota bacterium]